MSTPPDINQNGRQLFYCNGKIATEINGDDRWRFLQANDLILAQNNHNTPSLPITLVACGQQRSVLSMYQGNADESQAYSPYGHHIQGRGLLSLLAFNGERQDAITGRYHLGNGYRQFSPVMMRFCNPDSWSPFGAGGLNAYGYCGGDPANRIDPTGHFWGIGKFFRRLFGMKPKSPNLAKTAVPIVTEKPTKDNRASSLAERAGQASGDALHFEKLFNEAEIAEQFQLFERFNMPSRSAAQKNNGHVQFLGSSPDIVAGNRYRKFVNEQKRLLNEHNRALSLDALTKELDQVNTRMMGAGSSQDVMIQNVLQEQIRGRVD
ncbi:RHS repeat-associated core domain-containing protein [Pseudomonas putida]|uniref:RHS repeat-associated core domain-containing protein n=1 Tax=Pseudomonas putida TaxID=303 RepID=UPI001E2A1A8B|nr:RHS repeat-associated core domain-containing protein [Pseudomonas putida]